MIAKLKSAAAVNLRTGDTEVYSVSDSSNGAKLSELIIANKTTSQASAIVKIFKSNIDMTVTILPGVMLLANEGKVIGMSTVLETGDKIIIEPSVPGAIDVLISVIEL